MCLLSSELVAVLVTVGVTKTGDPDFSTFERPAAAETISMPLSLRTGRILST